MTAENSAPSDKKEIRVFFAAPGDLAVERRAFKKTVDSLNGVFGNAEHVKFVFAGADDSTAARPRGAVIDDLDSCDLFVLTLHRRWGQYVDDAAPFTTYAEEEFHHASARFKATGKPDLLVFLKNVNPSQLADPGPELIKALEFRKSLEESREIFYRTFEETKHFEKELERHIRAFVKGDLPKYPLSPEATILPLECLEAVEEAENKAKRSAERFAENGEPEQSRRAKNAEADAALARQAAIAASKGNFEDARQLLAVAIAETTSEEVLLLGLEFYQRTGELRTAEDLMNRILAIGGESAVRPYTAAAFGNLGLIYQTRGELDKAEEILNKALAINLQLANDEEIAKNYGCLGAVYRKRGKLEEAEQAHRQALTLHQKNRRQEGIATECGNLGVIYRTRNELDQAEEMFLKALAIDEQLGRQEGVVSAYVNLGRLYVTQSRFPQARSVLAKAQSLIAQMGVQSMAQHIQQWLESLPAEA